MPNVTGKFKLQYKGGTTIKKHDADMIKGQPSKIEIGYKKSETGKNVSFVAGNRVISNIVPIQ